LKDNAKKLKALFIDHHGFLIASPEYNSSITAVLKNAIDWASRPALGEASLACFDGKVASIMSASPGALGGLRGLVHLRSLLGNIRVIVMPGQIAIPKAHEAFDANGAIVDPNQRASVEKLGENLAHILQKLHS
jgi:chromate reductase, NAD(P)H dehydrogenase (quinone)